ncbi:uncharacterized protein YjiS (DUF1127 family) [Rhodobium orientis]|uniref:DUF1127 domain-containing protein n=1 Tax=Rhodobium orientis TaxID=34017 RepID=UPI001472FF99|nr:hypothetical protein [Rhodobium orientis]MBB4304129.1 uncharacterized protein YjiS (DUF1127 family) [Rhodobium orientis]
MSKELQSTGFLTRPAITLAAALKTLSAYVERRRQNRHNHRELRQMLTWSNRALEDIGLTRMDVRMALDLSGKTDAATWLASLKSERHATFQEEAARRLATCRELARRIAERRDRQGGTLTSWGPAQEPCCS